MDRVLHAGSRWLERYTVSLDRSVASITDGMDRMHRMLVDRVTGTTRLLKSLDPKAVLGRGYSFVRSINGQVIAGVDGLSKGQIVELQMKDGIAGASIQVIRKT